jgi:hypothetical protein
MSEGPAPTGKTKVQVLHENSQRSMGKKYSNYEEEPALRIADNGFGETWKSEFTAKGGFREGEIRGIRATMLTTQKRIKFIATCRVQDWDKLKPGFEKMLSSLGPPGATTVVTASPAPTP